MKKSIIATALGIFLGTAASYVLFLQIWTLVPWGLAGLALGYRAKGIERYVTGALYGFALAFVFMVANYRGADSLLGRLPAFSLLGLFGGVCGIALTLTGSFLYTMKTGRKESGSRETAS